MDVIKNRDNERLDLYQYKTGRTTRVRANRDHDKRA